MPPRYLMVSRWVGPSEVKRWMANGGTFIPPDIGRLSGWVYVTDFSDTDNRKPAGIGKDSTIRIDFGVPQSVVEPSGVGMRIRQPKVEIPIYNVSIHIPKTLDVGRILRHGGA